MYKLGSIFKIFFLGTSLFLNMPTLSSVAEESFLPKYKPPADSRKVYQRKETSVGGSRTFCQNPLNNKTLTLIVPEAKVVHQTASSRPTFYFYSEGASSIPLVFTLVDSEEIKPLVKKTVDVPYSGYHKIELPEEIKLEQNKLYSWHVAIPCSNNQKRFREVLRASLEYKPLLPHVRKQVDLLYSTGEQAFIYAEKGRWYDAINSINLDNIQVQSFRELP